MIPVFEFVEETEAGYFQCTAVDEELEQFTASALTRNEAAFDALFDCGGDDYQAAGCYIPEGYCRVR